MNTRVKFIYKAVSREGLGLVILASLSSTANAEQINEVKTAQDLPTSPSALYIGYGGGKTGSLTISSGETVVSGQDPAQGEGSGSVLGYDNNDNGTLTVDGGSWFDSVAKNNARTGGGTTTIGGSGNGLLDIKNGGQASAQFINIGQNSSGTGVINVDGVGSALSVSGDSSSGITIGTNGNGTLNISNGGKVTSNSVSSIGDGAGSVGAVNVSGTDSGWTINSSSLNVGRHGAGTLNISSGGKVNSAGGGIAIENAGSGTATIIGAGSTWDIGAGRILSVGHSTTNPNEKATTGTLILADQGKMIAQGGVEVYGDASTLVIGAQAGSQAVAAGILDAPKVKLQEASSSLLFNHTDTSGNMLFSSVVSCRRASGRSRSRE